MKKYLSSIFLLIFFSIIPLNAQKAVVIKNGGQFCEDYLLKKIDQERSEASQLTKLETPEPNPERMGQSAEISPLLKPEAFKTDNKALAENLEKWLEFENIDNLTAYELRQEKTRALILRSTNIQATGLAANFHYWYIRSDDDPTEFISLSKNPNLIFRDKSGLLNYYSIDLSDEFIEKKDWNNLAVDLLRYRITGDGKSQLIDKERNIKCQ